MINGYDPSIIMDAQDAESRERLMRQIGVANLDPPLPHSPCLKVIKTGVIHPWNPLLAAQRDLVECCDATGNTDPAAWQPLVTDDDADPRYAGLQAQKEIFTHYTPPMRQQNADGKTEYEKQGVESLA